MDKETNQGKFESIFSSKVRAGKRRTYFFDVRRTKGNDNYITLTESTKRFNSDGYERHKIFLYKEDFNRFLDSLKETIDHVKTELMPDYDYDEFTRRQEEWENRNNGAESSHSKGDADATSSAAQSPQNTPNTVSVTSDEQSGDSTENTDSQAGEEVDEEDMTW